MTTTKDKRLGLRTTQEQRCLLEAASEAEGTSLSDFILIHATRAAENVLADRRVFVLNKEQWNEFNQLLERPAEEIPGLRDLMKLPTVLDHDE